MLQLIHCDSCKATGPFQITFKVVVKKKHCSLCYHSDNTEWSYYFCDAHCFTQWLQEVKAHGLVCKDCHGTGYTAGFQSNGACDTCKGTGTIKLLG